MKYQRGQVGLVVLLITSVLLTIGVGVASQSVTEQKSSRQELESTEAFNAADETLDWALSQDLGDFDPLALPSMANFPGSLSVAAEPTPTYARVIAEGESGQLVVSPLDSDMTITWPVTNACDDPAIIISLFDSSGEFARYAYGPDCASRGNEFIVANNNGVEYSVTQTVTGFEFVRIKSVYGDVDLEVTGLSADQQYTVTAKAERNSGETRAVQAVKGLPAVPSIFDYAVFAGSGKIISN